MSTKFLKIEDESVNYMSRTLHYEPGKMAANIVVPQWFDLTIYVIKSDLLSLSFNDLNKGSSLFWVSGVWVIVDN